MTRAELPVRSAQRGRVRVSGIAAIIISIGLVIALAAARPGWIGDIGSTLARADWAYLAAAVLAQVFSIGSLARQQRRLLMVSGRALPLPAVVATTYVGGAISLSLPIVGKAAAAVYSYRRFTARGIRPAIVGWTLAMSALYLILAFSTIGAIGAIVTGSRDAIIAGIVSLAAVILPAGALLAAVRITAVRGAVDAAIDRIVTVASRATGRAWHRVHRGLHAAVNAAATVHLGFRDTVAVAGWSLLNFTATLASFILSILAIGGDVPWSLIVMIWAAGAGLGQLGLTPGGLGVVDAALAFGLIAAGMPSATAIAATLVYRAISLWLTVAAGGLTFLATGRPHRGR